MATVRIEKGKAEAAEKAKKSKWGSKWGSAVCSQAPPPSPMPQSVHLPPPLQSCCALAHAPHHAHAHASSTPRPPTQQL